MTWTCCTPHYTALGLLPTPFEAREVGFRASYKLRREIPSQSCGLQRARKLASISTGSSSPAPLLSGQSRPPLSYTPLAREDRRPLCSASFACSRSHAPPPLCPNRSASLSVVFGYRQLSLLFPEARACPMSSGVLSAKEVVLAFSPYCSPYDRRLIAIDGENQDVPGKDDNSWTGLE